MHDFGGEAALVTGGGSGIGRATAIQLARMNAQVMVSDVDEAKAEETASMIRETGGSASSLQCDVAKEGDVQRLIAETVSRFGRLRAAANVAGTTGCYSMLHEMALNDWQRTVDVNLTGTFLCVKHEIAHMIDYGGGAIVNVASLAAIKGIVKGGDYSAAKSGLFGLTRAATAEYASAGIRVNTVLPGITRTPMLERSFAVHPDQEQVLRAALPVQRLGEPSELAETICWLLSDGASFVTGQMISVDGGASAV